MAAKLCLLGSLGLVLIAMTLYTGFTIPVEYMRGWASWIRWLNPVYYGFESVMLNEFVGREFSCSQFVPSGRGYENITMDQQVCATVGSFPGSRLVSGTEHILLSYGYTNRNRWRNFGIVLAMALGLGILHLIVTEFVAAERSRGEILVFSRRKVKRQGDKQQMKQEDEENALRYQGNSPRSRNQEIASAAVTAIEQQTSVFHWEDVSYEIKIKGEPRTILVRSQCFTVTSYF